MIERVVFDLGGVVLHWQPMQVLRKLLPERIRNHEEAVHWATQIFQGFHPQSDWAQFDLGQIEPDALTRRIAQRVELSEQEVHAVVHGIPAHLTPMAGTLELIDQLHGRGVPLYFLSNMPASYADILRRKNDFFDRFRDGIFSAHVNLIKPERPIFVHADARFGGGGAGTLFIDDSEANIHTARAHGWKTIHFQDPVQCRTQMQAHGLV